LRNVAKTGPYFMHGSIDDLPEVVSKMAWHQIGKKVSPEEVEVVVAFLARLTGELPAEYIAEPTLPESTKKTPKADPS
jgi:cytochrome c peroxidase